MLNLNFSPVRAEEKQPEVFFEHPVLIVDGAQYDLSELPDGATAKHSLLGTVERSGDNYECTLHLPHGSNAPESTRFPDPIEVTRDGPVELPAYDNPEVINDLAE
ncbi:hypothetical protein [Marinobacter algicola]|uniref:Uncharacterized protein n=1 Tax=Marinobacter algicola DG893 TaxID=443152 RepID=A6F0I5_9GAMM|nr:hypothetical protein [Marinobacter algicola]EDM47746.1 hypothetical protein MDG893_20539 [Marinobacter algicola DG893]